MGLSRTSDQSASHLGDSASLRVKLFRANCDRDTTLLLEGLRVRRRHSNLHISRIYFLRRIDRFINLRDTNIRDILANDIVYHCGDGKAIEAGKGVYLPRTANVETVVNALAETGQQRDNSGEERRVRSPVDSELVVSVDAVSVVQLVDVEFLVHDEVVMATHGSADRAHEHAVPGQECQQAGCISDNLPRI